jgi:hypothetical protein
MKHVPPLPIYFEAVSVRKNALTFLPPSATSLPSPAKVMKWLSVEELHTYLTGDHYLISNTRQVHSETIDDYTT